MEGITSALPSVFGQNSKDNKILHWTWRITFSYMGVSAADAEPEEGSILNFKTLVQESLETV